MLHKTLHTASSNVIQAQLRSGGNVVQKAVSVSVAPVAAVGATAGATAVGSAITAGTTALAGGASIGTTMAVIGSTIAASPVLPIVGAAALVGGVVWGVASLFDN